MNKKLKIYSTLLIVAIVGFALASNFPFHYETSVSYEDEKLYFEMDGEEYVKHDTLQDGTIKSKWQPTFELTVNVRPKQAPGQPTLRSKEPRSIFPDPVKVEMQKVKIKIPFTKAESVKNSVLASMIAVMAIMIVMYIWIFCLVVKLIKRIRRGEVFTQQISKYLETSGILMVVAYLSEVVIGFIVTETVMSQVKIAYYNIEFMNESNPMLIFTGLALMIISQVILMGKELKEEQELTI